MIFSWAVQELQMSGDVPIPADFVSVRTASTTFVDRND
jgi:hypothetical protein